MTCTESRDFLQDPNTSPHARSMAWYYRGLRTLEACGAVIRYSSPAEIPDTTHTPPTEIAPKRMHFEGMESSPGELYAVRLAWTTNKQPATEDELAGIVQWMRTNANWIIDAAAYADLSLPSMVAHCIPLRGREYPNTAEQFYSPPWFSIRDQLVKLRDAPRLSDADAVDVMRYLRYANGVCRIYRFAPAELTQLLSKHC